MLHSFYRVVGISMVCLYVNSSTLRVKNKIDFVFHFRCDLLRSCLHDAIVIIAICVCTGLAMDCCEICDFISIGKKTFIILFGVENSYWIIIRVIIVFMMVVCFRSDNCVFIPTVFGPAKYQFNGFLQSSYTIITI